MTKYLMSLTGVKVTVKIQYLLILAKKKIKK